MRKRVIIADEIQLDGEFFSLKLKASRLFLPRVGVVAWPIGAFVGWLVGAVGNRPGIELVPKGDILEITKTAAGRYCVLVNDDRGPVPRKRVPGSAKGVVTVPEDFDAPIADFRDYQ